MEKSKWLLHWLKTYPKYQKDAKFILWVLNQTIQPETSRCVLGTMDFNGIMHDPFKEPSEHTNGHSVLGSMELNLIVQNPFKNLANIPMGVGFLI